MSNLRYTVLSLAVLLSACLAGNSRAQHAKALLHNLRDVEKLLASKDFQDFEDAIIMGAADNNSKGAQATLKAIRDLASSKPVDDESKPGLTSVLEGILTAVRIISAHEHSANEILDRAQEMLAQDTVGVADLISTSMDSLYDITYTMGVPLEDGHGAALAMSGGQNQAELKESMSLMQSAGSIVLEGTKLAKEISLTGIKAGGQAALDSLNAAEKIIDGTAFAAYEYSLKSARAAVEGTFQPVLNSTIAVTGITQSLAYNSSVASPEALAAIERLEQNYKSKTSSLRAKQSAIDASTILTTAFEATILESAEGIDLAKRAIRKAGIVASKNIRAAIALVQQGIKEAKLKFIDGATISFLGTGAARSVAGVPIEKLTEMMMEIIMGRVEGFDCLRLAEEAALIGLAAGGQAAAQGIESACLICDVAGGDLYEQFVDGGEMALNVFLS